MMEGYDVGMVCLIGATSVNRMPCQPRGAELWVGGGTGWVRSGYGAGRPSGGLLVVLGVDNGLVITIILTRKDKDHG
jgi:hypothetical protein